MVCKEEASRPQINVGSLATARQRLLNPPDTAMRISLHVMFPDPDHTPPLSSQKTIHSLVASHVPKKFGSPPSTVRLRECSMRWASVPKTAIQVHDNPFLPKNKIWTCRHHHALLAHPE